MALDLSVSRKAPPLPIELDTDMMYGLGRFCDRFGRGPMTQAGLKCLQAIPIAHAGLSVKEAERMSASTRNSAMAKCYQEISCPGWILVLEEAEVKGLRLPSDYKDRLYFTTLGTGKTAAKTFMQKEEGVFNKFSELKSNYTKGAQLWFATNQEIAAELPSGTNTRDALMKMEAAMYLKSSQYKKAEEEMREQAEELFGAGAAPAGGALPTPAAAAAISADLSQGVGEPSVGGAGEPGMGESGVGGASEADTNEPAEVMIPGDYIYPWILIACAWSPWSGNTPSQWKHLGASDGPNKRKKPDADITVDSNNPISSPSAMGRLNANGDAVSRRQHHAAMAAMKKEREQIKKAESDKENKEVRRASLQTSKESLETRKASLAVLEKAGTSVAAISANLQRLADQADVKAAQEARQAKISALEKKLLLGIGNPDDNKSKLGVLLDEHC